MQFLKTNTAVRISAGPFLDFSDGVTPETALTPTNTTLTMVGDDDDGTAVNTVLNTTLTASGGSNDMNHVANGMYDVELTAANTNRLGRVRLSFTDPDVHCPVFHEYMILPATVYDSLVAGTDTLPADVTQWLGQAVTADASNVPDVNIKALDADVITEAKIADNAIAAEHIAADAIGASELAADAVNEIRDSILTDATKFPGAAITEARLSELDAATAGKAAFVIDAIDTLTKAAGNGDLAAVLTAANAIQAKTDNLPVDPADQSLVIAATDANLAAINALNDIAATDVWAAATRTLTANTNLNDPTAAAIATAVVEKTLADAYAANGVDPTLQQAIMAVHQMLMDFSISGTSLTVNKVDGTTAFVVTLDDATNPTGAAR